LDTRARVGEDLTLVYGERVISQQLSLRVPDGVFTVIVGPNACGKSTLLRALSRLAGDPADFTVFQVGQAGGEAT